MTLAALRQVPLLAGLADADLTLLHGHSQWRWFQPGEVIVRQGQSAGDFCLVVQGQVELLLEGDHATRLGLLGPGEFFGELSVLTGEPAPATAVARAVTNLLSLSRDGLVELLDRNPQLNHAIITILSARVREAGSRLHRAKLRERSLADHIARQGERSHPDWVGNSACSQRVRAAIARGAASPEPILFLGEPGVGKELAAARVHYNGPRHDGPFIVYDLAQWNHAHWQESVRLAAHGTLLLKQAHLAPSEAVAAIGELLPERRQPGHRAVDRPGREPRLLATAPPPDDREPTPLEERFLAVGSAVPIAALRERRQDVPALVRHFLKRQGAHTLPVTAEAMRKLQSYPYLTGNVRELERVLQQALVLAGDAPVAPVHLRLGRTDRRSGRPLVGLALGGGVARGMAHIGVLKLLAEAGIKVDMMAGTSSGSLVGALYAGGLDVPALETLVGKTSWFDLATPCWPSGGFLQNVRMRSFLDRQIGPVRFSDLRLPFAVVAADINSGAEVILREGMVADAVRGSTAIPGVFRPVWADDRYLVDGVVVNNVPASIVRAMGADVVIAVDVTQYSFGPGRVRSLPEAMMRAFDITARQTVEASLEWADVVIRPQVAGMNGFAISLAPAYMQRGYEAARGQLAEIRSRLEQARQELTI